MEPIAIRKAEGADAESIRQVLERSVREICAPDYNYDEQILNAWCANKTIANIQKWAADPNNVFIVAENGAGTIVGVGLFVVSVGKLSLCYIVPEVKGTGVGKAILSFLEEAAAARGVRTIVLSSSITAESFYAHHGYVSNGPADDGGGIRSLPMKKELHPKMDLPNVI